MARKSSARPSRVCQIKVTLLGSRPAIWRRLLVSPDTNLEQLHWIVQAAMPWTNSHLHQFYDKDRTFYSHPEFDLEGVKDESRTRLRDLLVKPKDRIVYEYDFGDSWEHIIELEKIVPAGPKLRLPVCVAGKRAAPPDDCGGVWGYEHLLAVLKDAEHEEHDDMVAWLGGEEFDPATFDVDATNRNVRRVR